MEVTPVTYSTFRAIFLHQGASVVSVYRLIRDFSRRLNLPSKTAMTFMITTMAFILAFPTFASAMTGYSSNVQAFVPDQDSSNLVPFTNFSKALYMIHDGHRINKSDDYIVTRPSSRSKDAR